MQSYVYDWRVAPDSSNPYNPDYTPALRLHIYDPVTGKRSELIWEGAYNNVYGNEAKDTWYSTTSSDLFYQNTSGAGVTLNNGALVNQTIADGVAGYSSKAFVTALSVGDGSGASQIITLSPTILRSHSKMEQRTSTILKRRSPRSPNLPLGRC